MIRIPTLPNVSVLISQHGATKIQGVSVRQESVLTITITVFFMKTVHSHVRTVKRPQQHVYHVLLVILLDQKHARRFQILS